MADPTLIGQLISGDSSDRDLTIDYRVRVAVEGDWNSAINASGLPAFNSEHTSRKGYYARKYRCRAENAQNHYMAIVSIIYESIGEVNESATAPWLEPDTFTSDDVEIKVADGRYWDTDNQVWVLSTNSAGTPYNPPIERSRYVEKLTISACREADGWSPATFKAFLGFTNSDTVTIFGRVCTADMAKLISLPYQKKWWKNPATSLLEAYYDVQIIIVIDPETHAIELLDCGFSQKNGDDELEPIKDKDGNNTQDLIGLDGNGVALSLKFRTDPDKYQYLEKRLFNQQFSMSTLDLPEAE